MTVDDPLWRKNRGKIYGFIFYYWSKEKNKMEKIH